MKFNIAASAKYLFTLIKLNKLKIWNKLITYLLDFKNHSESTSIIYAQSQKILILLQTLSNKEAGTDKMCSCHYFQIHENKKL